MIKRKTTYRPTEYCLFHMALAGYDLYSRITGKKLTKINVWNTYKDRPTEIEVIKIFGHPDIDYRMNANHPKFSP